MGRGRHRKVSFAGIIILAAVIIICAAAFFMVYSEMKELKTKEQEYIMKEEQLEKQIDAEKERTARLEEKKKYVKTDEYIKEMARDKLGLIDPGELLFKEEGK